MVRIALYFASLLITIAFAEDVDKEKQSCKVCGYGEQSEQKKMVVNGDTVNKINKYPWLVSLNKVDKSEAVCTGALISSRFVLTAAHCLKKHGEKCKESDCFLHADGIEIGVWNGTAVGEAPEKKLKVAEVIHHPDFVPDDRTDGISMFDIGLIKLSEEVECVDDFGPICLYDKNVSKVSEYLHVAGWGMSTTKGEKNSEKPKLREGTVSVIPSKNCSHSEEDSNATDTIMCAKTGDSKQNMCMGDSGSSIFTKIGGAFYSLGVTSNKDTDSSDSHQCSLKDKARFTRVYSYLKWIKENVKELPKPIAPDG